MTSNLSSKEYSKMSINDTLLSAYTVATSTTPLHKELHKTVSNPDKTRRRSPLPSKRTMPDLFNRRSTVPMSSEIDQKDKGHTFVNQTFKKPTFCDVCQRLLLETTDKVSCLSPSTSLLDYQRQGMRCRICKLNIHEHCLKNVEGCNGAPLGTFGFTRRASGSAGSDSSVTDYAVDSVYQVLQQGRVLGKTDDTTYDRFTSCSPKPSPTNDKEGTVTSNKDTATTDSGSSNQATGTTTAKDLNKIKLQAERNSRQSQDGNIYAALFKYEPREKDDLELRIGDRIHVTKDKDEAWWLGECENRSGYFPAKFVAKIRPYEVVYVANKAIMTTDMNVKKNQVVFVDPDWANQRDNCLYVRIGSKEGFVPASDISPVS